VPGDYFEKLNLDRALLSSELNGISDSDNLIHDFASATWSLICEPGDTVAGLLRKTLGTEEALVRVVGGATPEEFLELIPTEVTQFQNFGRTLEDALQVWRRRATQADVFRSIQILKSLGGRLVTPKSSLWPIQLEDLGYGAPAALWVLGDLTTFQKLTNSVSVVGSRIMSDYGKAVTRDIVKSLVDDGKAIVSGGAIGIDAVAHERALELHGVTVAVMAGGIDRLYPSQNQELFGNIRNRGLLVSEVAPGVSPTKWRFLQRNRLIAALSQAIVVIEAGFRSGSINTVGHANELGRPVGAVPGPINSVRSAGCHQLIKDGRAHLISIPADLRELCGVADYTQQDFTSLGHWELRALDSLGDSIKTVEQVSKIAGLTTFEAETGLARLAKLGLVTPTSNGWVKR
jgi:DNA processing protein